MESDEDCVLQNFKKNGKLRIIKSNSKNQIKKKKQKKLF